MVDQLVQRHDHGGDHGHYGVDIVSVVTRGQVSNACWKSAHILNAVALPINIAEKTFVHRAVVINLNIDGSDIDAVDDLYRQLQQLAV